MINHHFSHLNYDEERRIPLQWFEEIAEILEPEIIYSHAMLIDFIQAHYPYVSKSSYHWGISGMI